MRHLAVALVLMTSPAQGQAGDPPSASLPSTPLPQGPVTGPVASPFGDALMPRSSAQRVQAVLYDPDRAVELQVSSGYQLTVELGADEQIENIAVGDSSAWQITPNRRGDRFFVKLLQGGMPTNMTVVTNVRSYLFDLIPSGWPSPDMPYTIRFTYPPEVREAAADATTEIAAGYRIRGSRAVRPSRVTDDGVHTYVEFPAERPLPAIFAVDADGQESIVNGGMRNRLFVIDSVAPRLVFRADRQSAYAERVKPEAPR